MYIEQIKEATTPEEMRKELYRVSFKDPLVRSIFNMADFNGLSAEDKYTLLAYAAMKDRNKFIRDFIDWEMVSKVIAPTQSQLQA